MPSFREFLKKTLPTPAVNWIRRWLATVRYVRFMSQNVFAFRSRLETGAPGASLDTPLADPFYQLIVQEVLERTDVILQQLDRKIEGQGARHGERLEALEAELAGLRSAVGDLRKSLEASALSESREPPGSRPDLTRPGQTPRNLPSQH